MISQLISVLTPLADTTEPDDLSAFGSDPWWIIGVKTLMIFVFLVLLTLFNIGGSDGSWPACSTGSAPMCTAPSACCSRSPTA